MMNIGDRGPESGGEGRHDGPGELTTGKRAQFDEVYLMARTELLPWARSTGLPDRQREEAILELALYMLRRM